MVGDLVGEGAAQEGAVVGETPESRRPAAGAGRAGHAWSWPRARTASWAACSRSATWRARSSRASPRRCAPGPSLGEGTAEGRFDALHGADVLTPLVGREHELALLLDRWERAEDGEGQVILLAGEPGIGKSRLIRNLRERLAGRPHTRLGQFCSPYHANARFTRWSGCWSGRQGSGTRTRRSGGSTSSRPCSPTQPRTSHETAPILADLLAIPAASRYPPLDLSPQQKKQRTFQVLLDQLTGLAARGPVLALYEDVHWADPTTLELLGRVIDRVQRLPVLVVVTFRPEFARPGPGTGTSRYSPSAAWGGGRVGRWSSR